MKHPIITLMVLCLGLLANQVNAQPSKKTQTGIASWYGYESGPRYKHAPKTASGEIFRPGKLTAAHRTLAFGTKLQVTNTTNNKSVIVTVNDRGPFVRNRIIDLSKAAAAQISMHGIQKVTLHVIN